ncbi:MAG: transketolase family protein [Deltaproteobacteria bacterium]|nr:transketolase family protein [Deltaproteobacteria bacterium]
MDETRRNELAATEHRRVFGETLVEIGRENEKLVVLDCDVATSTGSAVFRDQLPQRFYQIGIAEQNATGMLAGMITQGDIPVLCIFSFLAASRAVDPWIVQVAHDNMHGIMAGSCGGIDMYVTGASHQPDWDLGVMRSIPNVTVIVPGDVVELKHALRAAVEDVEGPVYFRYARSAHPVVFDDDYRFRVGKGIFVREGTDVCLVSTGTMVSRAVQAADMLQEKGIRAGILHLPTIKPVDKDALIRAANETGALVTMENHGIIGGLGSVVSEVLSEHSPVPLRRVGIRDQFVYSAHKAEDLYVRYRMTPKDIVETAEEVLKMKK